MLAVIAKRCSHRTVSLPDTVSELILLAVFEQLA